MRPSTNVILAALLVKLAVAADAAAQPAVASVEAARDALPVRETLAAITTDRPPLNRIRQEVEGRGLRSSVARALNVSQGPASQTTKPRNDSLLNGVLIGAGVGAALGLIPDYYDDCEECHDSLYASIAVGAGIGLLVDALRTNRQQANPSISGVPVRVDVAVRRRGIDVRTMIHWH